MRRPACRPTSVRERSERTAQGYRRLRRSTCDKQAQRARRRSVDRAEMFLIRVLHGRWKYLYRAIDPDGALVEVMLRDHRDLAAAKAFFRSAKAMIGVTPDRVRLDGHAPYPNAIRTVLGKRVRHRTSRYLNDRLEQDHRGIKSRCRPMLGFMNTEAAGRYCRAHVVRLRICLLLQPVQPLSRMAVTRSLGVDLVRARHRGRAAG